MRKTVRDKNKRKQLRRVKDKTRKQFLPKTRFGITPQIKAVSQYSRKLFCSYAERPNETSRQTRDGASSSIVFPSLDSLQLEAQHELTESCKRSLH